MLAAANNNNNNDANACDQTEIDRPSLHPIRFSLSPSSFRLFLVFERNAGDGRRVDVWFVRPSQKSRKWRLQSARSRRCGGRTLAASSNGGTRLCENRVWKRDEAQKTSKRCGVQTSPADKRRRAEESGETKERRKPVKERKTAWLIRNWRASTLSLIILN